MLDERSIYLRSLVLRAMRAGRRGHWGSSSSLIEIMRVLYDDIANHGTKDNPDRDRIILSKGHGVLAQAVLLADKGYIPLTALDDFCKKEGAIGGHPSPEKMNGIECHTGALGHGLPIAVGMALAAKIRKQKHKIYVILGDGECNEGSIWEAALSAAKHKLDNLMVIVDYNKIQSSGFGADICPMEPMADKWKSFGFAVAEADGHNIQQLSDALDKNNPWWTQKLKGGEVSDGGWIPVSGKPKCLIAHTTKGKGISFAENNPMWHYKSGIDDKIMAEMEEALG